MFEMKIPDLGESIIEGTIVEWLKGEGDAVRAGDAVALVETDKVNVEVTAEQSGILQKIVKQKGETVKVGETIALLEVRDADAEPGTPDQGQRKSEPTSPASTALPPASSSDSAQAEEQRAAQAPVEPLERDEKTVKIDEKPSIPHASPAARKLARQRGLDLRRLQVHDPLGRITMADVQRGVASAPSPQQPSPVVVKQPAGLAAAGRGTETDREAVRDSGTFMDAELVPAKPVERQRMSRRRQTIAQRLVEAQQTAAMLTTFNEVDMTAVNELRKRWKEPFYEEHHVKLGYMSFFTKAVVGALKAFPYLNAEIQGDEILLKKYYDIGIAVATEGGLVVPVVRNADRLSFAEIEREIASLAEKARNNKLTLEELQGGTFTITNGGVFGSLFSTPILNTPQVGIIGMHAIQKRPVAVGDEMQLRPMMYLALSYDHRIVDGREAVSFLVKVKTLLENPESLLLNG